MRKVAWWIVSALERLEIFWGHYTRYRARGESRRTARDRAWWYAGGRP